MKEQYVSTLAEGQSVDTTFVLKGKELRVARTGDAYLSLEIADRSGTLSAVRFRPSEADVSTPVGVAVRIRGRVTAYRGRKRVSVEHMRPAESFEREDMLPGRRRDADEVRRSLRRHVSTVRDATLRGLLTTVFGDELFLARFLDCPMSPAICRAYVGGLAEHAVAVARLCEAAVLSYPEAHRDLLITGALLHDIGMVDQLVFDTTIGVSDEGLLLGHEVLGERRIQEAAGRAPHPLAPELLSALSHAVLTHHAVAPAALAPRTLEAVILQGANSLDLGAAGFVRATAAASADDERWTDERNSLGRSLLVPHALAVAAGG